MFYREALLSRVGLVTAGDLAEDLAGFGVVRVRLGVPCLERVGDLVAGREAHQGRRKEGADQDYRGVDSARHEQRDIEAHDDRDEDSHHTRARFDNFLHGSSSFERIEGSLPVWVLMLDYTILTYYAIYIIVAN